MRGSAPHPEEAFPGLCPAPRLKDEVLKDLMDFLKEVLENPKNFMGNE